MSGAKHAGMTRAEHIEQADDLLVRAFDYYEGRHSGDLLGVLVGVAMTNAAVAHAQLAAIPEPVVVRMDAP